jgi:Derlin-2/3
VLFTEGYVFTEALILAFVYTSSQDDRGQKANLFFITMPAPWLPFAMILVTLVTSGLDAAIVQSTGLIAAHLHDFLTRIWPTFGGGRNLLPTPDFVKRWFMVSDSHTTVSAPTGSASASGSSTGNVLPESWRNRGSGHRLGGN